jgi:hypothetical protein
MNKALLWAGCCLLLFLTFLWITSRPKAVRTRDLSESQPVRETPAKAVETEHSVTKIPSDVVTRIEEPALPEDLKPAPDKPYAPKPGATMDLKKFASDEILALPFPEQKKFLTKNQLQDPEKFTSFRNISQLTVIEQYLKGDFQGKIEGQGGQEWFLHLNIDGEVEAEHFQGEIAVELLDKNRSPLSRSHLRGPLDDHIRVVEQGERSSLLIQPSGPENIKLYQVFIGGENKQQLTGNYYARNGEGKLQILGSFVLKKGAL